MGQAKKAWMEHQENIAWAKTVLKDTGSISECELHDLYVDNLAGDPEDAIAIARKDPPAGLTPDEAEALIREALNDVGDECYICAKNAADDS